jgi:hypothetical protein
VIAKHGECYFSTRVQSLYPISKQANQIRKQANQIRKQARQVSKQAKRTLKSHPPGVLPNRSTNTSVRVEEMEDD